MFELFYAYNVFLVDVEKNFSCVRFLIIVAEQLCTITGLLEDESSSCICLKNWGLLFCGGFFGWFFLVLRSYCLLRLIVVCVRCCVHRVLLGVICCVAVVKTASTCRVCMCCDVRL